MIGAVAGLLVAAWGSDALAGLKPLGVPRLGEVRMDGAVIAFTIGIALVTGLLVGAVPALQATGRAMAGALKEGGRGALTGRRSARILGTLVAGEIALAVALLAGAGLLVNSFIRVQQVDPGFHTTDALTFGLSLPEATYKTQQSRIQFFDRLLDELGRMPGVRSAGSVVGLPLTKLGFTITFKVDGRPESPAGHEPTLQVRVASPDYFRTMGLPLKRGRLFTERRRVHGAAGGAADRVGRAEVLSQRGSARPAHRPGLADRRTPQRRHRRGRRRRREGSGPGRGVAAGDLPAVRPGRHRHHDGRRARRPAADGRISATSSGWSRGSIRICRSPTSRRSRTWCRRRWPAAASTCCC